MRIKLHSMLRVRRLASAERAREITNVNKFGLHWRIQLSLTTDSCGVAYSAWEVDCPLEMHAKEKRKREIVRNEQRMNKKSYTKK